MFTYGYMRGWELVRGWPYIVELVHTVNSNYIRALYLFCGMSVIELPGLLVC